MKISDSKKQQCKLAMKMVVARGRIKCRPHIVRSQDRGLLVMVEGSITQLNIRDKILALCVIKARTQSLKNQS